MTSYASENARIARKYFARNTIMIPLGGGNKCLAFGQDEAGLAKEMKKRNVSIRSTAGCASHLAGAKATEHFCQNYAYVKLISTACKYYHTPNRCCTHRRQSFLPPH